MITKSICVLTVTLVCASGFLVLPKRPKTINRQQLSRKRFVEDANENEGQALASTVEKVKVELLYETRCQDCMQEYSELPKILEKIGDHIDLYTLPYGNAKTYGNKVTCQHGEAECYGNKLHACAIDILKDVGKWVKYNACMMAQMSTDAAADECGSNQHINSSPIKACARGTRGQQLLIEYGKISRGQGFVPEVIINDKPVVSGGKLFNIICKSFKEPPKNCKSHD